MSTHATAAKQWTEAELDALNVENNIRMRGLEITRLDTFIDAAFAFVLTLLVISFDRLPSNQAEMLAALKQIPAFAASFAILMTFWLQHRRWTRRYGLENTVTVTLSLLLIFVVLVYVYPLRVIFEALFSDLSGQFFPTTFQIQTYDDLRLIFLLSSIGFLAMELIVSQLYWAAYRSRDALMLCVEEIRRTRLDMHGWLVVTGFSAIAIILALFLPDRLVSLAGYVYVLLYPIARIPAYIDRRR